MAHTKTPPNSDQIFPNPPHASFFTKKPPSNVWGFLGGKWGVLWYIARGLFLYAPVLWRGQSVDRNGPLFPLRPPPPHHFVSLPLGPWQGRAVNQHRSLGCSPENSLDTQPPANAGSHDASCAASHQVSPKPQWPAMLWAAAATSFLLRPSAALRARLAHDLAHLPPYRMAMYIRHCDKGGEAVLQPMRAYVRALLGPGSGYPVARAPVYLVTDDADIYRHLQPDPGQSATPLHPPGDRTLLPYIFGNSSTRALRTCRWCNATVGASGAGACFRAHEERALLDLHLLAHAPVAASTFSSNYGQLLLFLQLFRHAFCAASLPVDSYFHALGHGWAYLRRAAPLSQGAGWVQLRQSVTLVRTAGAGRGDKDRTAAPLSAQEVAGMADDAVEAQDPWARAVHATCNVSTVADPAAGDATPAGCGHFRSVADRLWCHFRRHKARIVGRIWRGDRRGAGTSLPLELTAP